MARTSRGLLALLALLGSACGASDTGLRALAPGQAPTAPAAALAHHATGASGVLTYAVELAGERLVAVELAVAFELVVRELIGQRLVEVSRVPLGSADYDVVDLAIDAARDQAWVASRDGTVRAIDLKHGQISVTWRLGSSATAVAVSPDGHSVVTGTADGIVCLRRRRDSALLQCVVGHGGAVASAAFDRAGDALVTASWDGTVVVWRVPSLAITARRSFAGSANEAAFDPTGQVVAVARSAEPPVRTPDIERREQGGAHTPHPDHAVSIWPLDGGQERVLRGHGGPVTAVAWTRDGARVVSGSWDRTVRLWDPRTGRHIARHGGFSLLVTDLAVGPNGRLVAAGAWTRALKGPASVVLDLLYPRRASSR